VIMGQVMIGLETHVQLNTNTKMFCGCSIRNMSKEPNTRCCPTCLGMPGSKPRLNAAAIESGMKIAVALGCDIAPEIFFSRKTYFYPDMSKNFQITQYEMPLARGGSLETLDENGKSKAIGIERINLEEDPAKLEHVGGDITTADYVLIDYNRSGIPLCEIVTKPEFSSSHEVVTFLKRLSNLLEYLQVFVKGELTLKTDVNISIKGHERVEIKNMSSFGDIEKAIEYEMARQTQAIEKGEETVRQTMTWDDKSNTTKMLRKKEFEEDYGYIFEPDLTVVEINKNIIEEIRKNLPEMPHQKCERYVKTLKLSVELSNSITSDFQLANLFEETIKHNDIKLAATWIGILRKTLSYNSVELSETKLDAATFDGLLKLIQGDKVTDRGAELILREIIFKPEKLEEMASDLSALDVSEVDFVVDEVLKENEKAVEDLESGEEKSMDFLVGQVIMKIGKKADAKKIKEMIRSKTKKSSYPNSINFSLGYDVSPW
jgi:aspartyl-tRNA(Asn)/glutamyl-tRNA(Gln) amidotransferase subunit B